MATGRGASLGCARPHQIGCARHNNGRADSPLVLSDRLLALLTTLGSRAAQARAPLAGPVYGGTMHVAYTGGVATLDPAHSYNDDWWLINGTLFNGLYQFDRNGQPQLDLAAGPPA